MAYTQQVLGNTGCLFLKGICIPFYSISRQEWILLDSGPRFVRQELEGYLQEQGIRIRAVVCSHAHFDHTENNRYLQATQGARIVMSVLDAGIVQDAIALKTCFYSYSRLENEQYNREMICKADQIFGPWQQADGDRPEWRPDADWQEEGTWPERRADAVRPEREAPLQEQKKESRIWIQVEGVPFQVLSLPGHAASHVGFVTPDGAAYLADSLFSPDPSGAERLTYMLDWGQALKTMEQVGEYDYERCILAHGGVYDQIRPLAEENRNRFGRMLERFQDLFAGELTQEQLLEKSAGRYHFTSENYEKVCLFERVIRSMTEYLVEQGRISRRTRGGILVYGP